MQWNSNEGTKAMYDSRIILTSFGTKAANELTVKEDTAPRPTNVFMFGAPLNRLFTPSRISWNPGPSNVNKDRERWNPVEWNTWIHDALAPKIWERCPTRHTAHNAQETASPRPNKCRAISHKFLSQPLSQHNNVTFIKKKNKEKSWGKMLATFF